MSKLVDVDDRESIMDERMEGDCGTPAEEIAMLRDKIKELEEENTRLYSLLGSISNVKTDYDETIFQWLDNRDNEAEERGAREMAEIIYRDIYNLSSGDYQSHVEAKLQLWRERKNK